MKKRKTFGQIIITAMFIWSALLCHFEASTLREEGDFTNAALYWFFGFTAVLGAFRFKIAELIYGIIKFKSGNRKLISNCLIASVLFFRALIESSFPCFSETILS